MFTGQWIQPNCWQEGRLDLVSDDARIFTYRVTNHLIGAVEVADDNHSLIFTPTWLGAWLIHDSEGLLVTTIFWLLKRRGSFTTAEGTTYEWHTTNFWGTERAFNKVEDETVLRIQHVWKSWFLRANVTITDGDIPERDAVMLAGLGIHMLRLEMLVVIPAVLLLPIILIIL
ncbi:MAG: hypothetical protein ACFB51_17260 [Anaerolineae bacterium]